MEIKDLKQMSDEDIFKLQDLVNVEAKHREKIAEYKDRFKDLFEEAKRDGIGLGVSTSNGHLIIAHSYDDLYVGKWWL